MSGPTRPAPARARLALLLLAALAAAVPAVRCARELAPSHGEGGLELVWSWPAGIPESAAVDSARLWVLDARGRAVAGPVAAEAGPEGTVDFVVRVPAGQDRTVRLQFEGAGVRGRGVLAAALEEGIDISAGGQTSVEARLRPVVPRLDPVTAAPGDLEYAVRWSRPPFTRSFELFERTAQGERWHAVDDTSWSVSLREPRGFAGVRSLPPGPPAGRRQGPAALDSTFYRVRAILAWGARSVASDSVGLSVPALKDLPYVVEVEPAPETAGVVDTAEVVLRFDRSMRRLSLGDPTVPAEENVVTLREDPDGPILALRPPEWRAGDSELALRPVTSLRRGARFLLRVLPGLTDLDGRPLDQDPARAGLQGFESRFRAESYDTLRVVSATPPDDATEVPLRPQFELRCNRPVLAASVSAETVRLFELSGGGERAIPLEVALVGDSVLQAELPDSVCALRHDAIFRLEATPGLRDQRGEPLDQDPRPGLQAFQSTFRTVAAPAGPRVVSVAPAGGERNAPVGQVVRVRFSRDMEPETVLDAVQGRLSVQRYPSWAKISGRIEATPDPREFTFTPSNPLERGHIYRVKADSGGYDPRGCPAGLRDRQGAPFDQDSVRAGFQEFTSVFRVEDNPRVLSVSPAHREDSVDVETAVVVRFSLALARASAVAGGLTLRLADAPVPLAGYEFSSDTTVVTLHPAEPLAWYREYAVRADTSLRSNRGSRFDQLLDTPGYQAFTSTFRTATDRIKPRVVEWFPGDDAENAPIDAEILVRFNRPVVPATVCPQRNFLLRRLPAGVEVEAACALAPDSLSATLQPVAPLDYVTTYEVIVRKFVEDIFGQPLDQDPSTPLVNDDFVGRFRTDHERISPRVSQVSPTHQSVNVPVDSPVVVHFDEPMAWEGTVPALTVTGPDGVVPGQSRLEPDTVLTFTATQPLRYAVRYDVRVDTTATDLAGNGLDQNPQTGELDPFTSFFVTAADLTPPRVLVAAPADGDTAVEVTVRPRLDFDEPMDPASLATGVRLFGPDSAEVPLEPPQVAPDGRSVTLTPADSLRFDALYTLEAHAGARDTSGNGLDQDPGEPGAQSFRAVFRTRRENIPPRVLGVRFDGGGPTVPVATRLWIAASEPIDAASLAPDRVALTRDGEPVAAMLALAAPDTILLAPADTLAYDAEYLLEVSGVTDLAGNELDQDPAAPGAQGYALSFRTEIDLVPPRVIAVEPAPDAEGVPVETWVEILFSEPMDSASVIPAGLGLFDIDGVPAPVPGTVSAEPGLARYVFRPSLPLEEGRRYRVEVDTEVRDVAGNRLDQDPSSPGTEPFSSEFRTGVPPEAQAGPGICDPADSVVTVSATGSSDPDGLLRRAIWDWGDGERDTLDLPHPDWPVHTHVYGCLDVAGCDGLDNDGDGATDETGAEGCDESRRIILSVEDEHGLWAHDTTGVSFCAFLATAAVPADGSTGIDSLLTAVRVSLSRTLDPDSLDGNLVRLETEAGDSVGVELGVSGAGSTVVLTLLEPLRGGTTYVVRALTGLRSADGRRFDQDPCEAGEQPYASRFTTRSPEVPAAPAPTAPAPGSEP